eukprot:NODE_47_length_32105_cov_1.240892.p5 type:complete len:508 gc:universal NODE_47_length_32105_cov_1.240892:16079-17602(+)
MYTLLTSFLVAVSIDCPIIIQLALDLDIKYTNTEYFIQYEKDCCLGVGVICENERVTELHWGFAEDYGKRTYPEIQLPPKLRVLDMSHSIKTMIIKKLPDTLKVMDFYNTNYHALELQTLPNLTYFRYHCYFDLKPPILPILPDTLEHIDFEYCSLKIFPLNATNLKEAYYDSCNAAVPSLFPNLPETIERVSLWSCNFHGQVGVDFKHVVYLDIGSNYLEGNLTISSPNITVLETRYNKFDRMFVSNIDQIQYCRTENNYFEPDNVNELTRLQSKGCTIDYKSPPSPDCPNLILFLKQLNFHLLNPKTFDDIASLNNCCDSFIGSIYCSGNRVTRIGLDYGKLNGTINSTLLPDSLYYLSLSSGEIGGLFPDFSGLANCQEINLGNNQLIGPIYGKLPNNLKYLYISNNQLNGTIPNLNKLTDLDAGYNYFDSVENQLSGNNLESISILFNKIAGIIDMSNYDSKFYGKFNFRNNLIDKILTLKNVTQTGCDVSLNNIPQADSMFP